MSAPSSRPGAPPRTGYTPAEVAASIGRPYRRVLRMIRDGQLRANRIGQHYVIPKAALEEFHERAS